MKPAPSHTAEQVAIEVVKKKMGYTDKLKTCESCWFCKNICTCTYNPALPFAVDRGSTCDQHAAQPPHEQTIRSTKPRLHTA